MCAEVDGTREEEGDVDEPFSSVQAVGRTSSRRTTVAGDATVAASELDPTPAIVAACSILDRSSGLSTSPISVRMSAMALLSDKFSALVSC
jgi:hypothetical protein